MINLVLSSLPLFFSSIFKIPEGIARKLVSLKSRFLWGCEGGREKISCVGWENICCPKEHGGLEVKNISLFNNDLLAKWR